MIATITGQEARARRIRARISQTMLAGHYGKSQATMSDIERTDAPVAKVRFVEALEAACQEKFGCFQMDLEDLVQ